jgi:hypothetical protein
MKMPLLTIGLMTGCLAAQAAGWHSHPAFFRPAASLYFGTDPCAHPGYSGK